MNDISPLAGRAPVETTLSDRTFARIAQIAQKEAGIVLPPSKISMVRSRLTRRLRALTLGSFDAYLDYLMSGSDPSEMDNFISALTTNVSHFFRENHHFDTLTHRILPAAQQKLARGGKVRIWSAGCSNGQEPYSIAMTLLNADPSLSGKNIKILATDIDPEVLRLARSGCYHGAMAQGLNEETMAAYFTRSGPADQTALTLNANVRRLVTFRHLNLHADWPMQGRFDVIFCRNVMIYFNEETQIRLYRRFAQILEPEGWLLLGHSERVHETVSPLFKPAGVTTYRTLAARNQTPSGDRMS
ncbi:CheR family methyltransferase [Celeribacter indicus]|uniref:Chemotaxis protein methyltransferase n=1 Tax=Celeribacter indicus TaxID=1208324 RepID=A0A0B5E380_9RHOB|nr:protein-glutamate O-methyltransferase CheR [Celeribacter indicus]AJE46897.1 chemotaxis protein CheR [Celeribacter indicus]SDW79200.1 chemotaxis protein methyltransferase CheR [Celeribacter indicus]